MNKKLLVLTGPQGSGNHMFSKIFASSDEIGGWKDLLDHYWLGHHTEPFNAVWRGERDLRDTDFKGYRYWVTSISIPYVSRGEMVTPDIDRFIRQAEALGVETVLGVVGRDRTILEFQQQRVRGACTLGTFMEVLGSFEKPVFLSHESITLYGQAYVNWICDLIGFPRCRVPELEDANRKYIRYVDTADLDKEVERAKTESKFY